LKRYFAAKAQKQKVIIDNETADEIRSGASLRRFCLRF
jgi:hypothetical protein